MIPGLLFPRHEVAQHDASDNLLAVFAGMDGVATVPLKWKPRAEKPRIARRRLVPCVQNALVMPRRIRRRIHRVIAVGKDTALFVVEEHALIAALRTL